MVSLKSLLDRALDVVQQPRTTPAVSKTDPLYPLILHDVKGAVASLVGDDHSYKTAGSVGAGSWAYTPWVAIVDPQISEFVRHGFCVVYLFHHDGAAVVASLNQGTSSVRASAGKSQQDILEERARNYAAEFDSAALSGLQLGRLDLGRRTSPLTQSYESGNIASVSYSREAIPNDRTLAADLERLLALYRELVDNPVRADISR
jgi:hypothetical protein